MKNKALIIIGTVMILLAVISVVSYFALKPSEDTGASELSANKSVLSDLPEEEATTRKAQEVKRRKTTTYKWEPVIEPTISENYMIITAAGGDGEWQVFENEDSYENGYKPEGGAIIIE